MKAHASTALMDTHTGRPTPHSPASHPARRQPAHFPTYHRSSRPETSAHISAHKRGSPGQLPAATLHPWSTDAGAYGSSPGRGDGQIAAPAPPAQYALSLQPACASHSLRVAAMHGILRNGSGPLAPFTSAAALSFGQGLQQILFYRLDKAA